MKLTQKIRSDLLNIVLLDTFLEERNKVLLKAGWIYTLLVSTNEHWKKFKEIEVEYRDLFSQIEHLVFSKVESDKVAVLFHDMYIMHLPQPMPGLNGMHNKIDASKLPETLQLEIKNLINVESDLFSKELKMNDELTDFLSKCSTAGAILKKAPELYKYFEKIDGLKDYKTIRFQ